MTTRKINDIRRQLSSSIETAWNRLSMGVRARNMPKTIKRVKQTLKGEAHAPDSADWSFTARETEVLEGVTFHPKYMGSTLIEELVNPEPGANYYNTGLSTKALDRIIRMCHNKALVKVSLAISPKGVQVISLKDRQILLDVPMDRVSFCTHDKKYAKVTAFIARNYTNDMMECYAFLCDKQKMAKAITAALSRVFYLNQKNRGDHEMVEDTQPQIIDQMEIPSKHEELKEKMSFSPPAEESEINHNLFGLDDSHAPPTYSLRREHSYEVVDDNLLLPAARGRSDSDSWAVMATATHDDEDGVDEFSSFARSRSSANLCDMEPTIQSNWIL